MRGNLRDNRYRLLKLLKMERDMKTMKKITAITALLLIATVAFAKKYEPKAIFSKVTSGDVITTESENYKLKLLEDNINGFADGTEIVGTWTVESRIGLGGAVPVGWTLDSLGLYYYASQTITFNEDGTYTTDTHNLYVPPYTGPDSGIWNVEGNQFIVMSTRDLVNGLRSYRSPINKVNDYEWNATIQKRQAGLYFSKPDAPPNVPINLTATLSEDETEIELTWEHSQTCDGFVVSERKDTLDTQTGYWITGEWISDVAETASDIKTATVTADGPGRYLFRVQAFFDDGVDKNHSPVGGGNTTSLIIQ